MEEEEEEERVRNEITEFLQLLPAVLYRLVLHTR